MPSRIAELADPDRAAVAQQHRALEQVAELAQVAGPRVVDQRVQRGARHPHPRTAELAADPDQQAVGQDRDVLGALAQRRHAQRQRSDPEVQVAAEPLRGDQSVQIVVGRGDQAHRDRALADVAEPAEPLVLQDLEQLGLDREVHVADLVEKQDPAVRDLQQAGLGRHRTRECPSLVTEQLALQELPRQRRAVEIDECFLPARSVAVAPAREHALTGAGLPEQQQRAVGGDHPPRVLGQRADRRAGAEERIELGPGLAGVVHDRALAAGLALEQPRDQRLEQSALDRLGDEALGALLDGLDGEVDRAVAAEHDARHLGIGGPQLADQLDPVAVRQAVLDQHDVGPVPAERRDPRLAAPGLAHREAAALQ